MLKPREVPPVAVCVPTYRRPVLLRRALESVASQTYSGALSCVVSENGRTEGTYKIVADLREAAPQVQWILIQDGEMLPPVENWRRAVATASEGWVKILWDDDWMEPRFIERTIQLATSTGVSAVTTAARVVSPDGSSRLLYEKTPLLRLPGADDVLRRYTGLLPALPVSPAAALLRRDLALEAIDKSRILGACFDTAMGPDLAMILTPALQGSLAHLPEVLVNFWAGEDSITMTSDELRLRLCYDRAMIQLAAAQQVELPGDVRRRLQHRSFLAWARREPNRQGLLPPRPSATRLARNVWDRRSRLLRRS